MAANPEVAAEFRRVARAVSDALPPGQTIDFVRGYERAAYELNQAIGPCGCDPVPEGPQNAASPPPPEPAPISPFPRHNKLHDALKVVFPMEKLKDYRVNWMEGKVRVRADGDSFDILYYEIDGKSPAELCSLIHWAHRFGRTVGADDVPERLRVPYRQSGEEWQDTAMKQLRTMDRQLAEIKRLKAELQGQRKLLGETQARLEGRIENQKATIEVLREANARLYEFDLGRLADYVRKLASEAQTQAEMKAVAEIEKIFAGRKHFTFAPGPIAPDVAERLRGVRATDGVDPNPGSYQMDLEKLKKAKHVGGAGEDPLVRDPVGVAAGLYNAPQDEVRHSE